MNGITPELQPNAVGIADLFPTQMTVGMREVDIKRHRWRERDGDEAANYLNTHQIPVILGPGNHHYIIDRHHLLLALHEEGVSDVPVSVVVNMSGFGFDEFWTTLESCNWIHPFDDQGQRHRYDDMPASVNDLIDDPFRSLAGAVKRAGGYAKDRSPFSEFRWADYLRLRIAREQIERDFDRTLGLAMDLAQTTEAAALPGWRLHPEH